MRERIGPSRFISISYESLTSEPELTMRLLCKFLGVRFNQKMLEFYKSDEAKRAAEPSELWGNVAKPIMADNTRKFLRDANQEDIRVFECARNPAMVSIFQYVNSEVRRLSIKELNQQLQQPEGTFWVDLEDPIEAAEETLLVSIFDFHPLAIEDCQRGGDEEGHLPKVEDFGDYLFVIFNPVEVKTPETIGDGQARNFDIRTTQLSAFLGKRYLITPHVRPLRSITYAQQLCGKNPLTMGRGTDYLFHLIIDHIVDAYTPILDKLDEIMDAMEDEVFRSPDTSTMMSILQMKRNITTVRRVALYQPG